MSNAIEINFSQQDLDCTNNLLASDTKSILQLHNEILDRIHRDAKLDLLNHETSHATLRLQEIFKNVVETHFPNENPQFLQRIETELFSCGPLEKLISDLAITEIMVNGYNSIWYEKNGSLYQYDDAFLSPINFFNFIERMTSETKSQANIEIPYADGVWREFRVHIAVQPIAKGGPCLTLRRRPHQPWSFAKLATAGWARHEPIRLIEQMIRSRKNILFIGPTGSGKTSVLSASLNLIEKNERAIIIEDTPEIPLPNQASLQLCTRTDNQGALKEIDLTILVRQALRMRPDRIVVGEVRGAEAKDLILALSTGHSGSFCTLHAENPRQALMRLEILVQLGAPQWSIATIRNLIFFGLHAIVCVEKQNGRRVLKSLHTLSSLEECGFTLEQIY